MADVNYKAPPPSGYEASCKPNEDGWPVWKTFDGEPPCAHGDCDAPYNEEEPAMALQCPTCDRPGCHECMPGGRGCECPSCEEGYDDE